MEEKYNELKEGFKDTKPLTEEYEWFVRNLTALTELINWETGKPVLEGPVDWSKEPKPEPKETKPEPKETKTEKPKEEPKEEPKEDYLYTREAVREILTNASRSGIKIQPIMQPFIPEGMPAKLSSVPAKDYAALVEAVNNAG